MRRIRNFSRRKTVNLRRRGSMSIMIVIFAVSATLMITSGLALTTGASAVQRGAMAREQATFLADAGLAHAMIYLKNNSTWRVGFTNVALGAGTYTVTLTDVASEVVVASTGTVGTFSVQVSNRVGWGS